MDRQRALLVTFFWQIFLYTMCEISSHSQHVQLLFLHQRMSSLLLVFHIAEFWRRHPPQALWKHDRLPNFVECFLLGSFNRREFKTRMRMEQATFIFICSSVAPYMQRVDTRMRRAIPLETRVAIAISRLATGHGMQMIADLYEVGLSTSQKIVLEFLGAVKKSLKKKNIKWPSSSMMAHISTEFEALHQIPHIVGAVDGSHIPIVAPSIHAPDYYNRKGFHSVLLQGVVTSRCIFWDYDIGWAGSMHDSNLWSRTRIGRFCEEGRLAPYALVRDASYPACPWMFPPFKGHKDGLSREQYHWNFIQSSTRMCVERSFGLLKGRWRILLKRMEVKLQQVPDIVGACIILHNICQLHGDKFDDEWVSEAQAEVHDGKTFKVRGQSQVRI